MQVVNISLDPKVLDANSVASNRNRLYGEMVDHYRVVVHYHKDVTLELSPTVTVYGVGGKFKFVRLFRVALKLRQLVKSGQCDVITSSDPYFFGTVAYLVAKLHHVGCEAHILGIEKLNFVRKFVAKFFVKRAGAVRVNSTRLRQRVSDEFGVSFNDIKFVPIYVPTDNLGFALAAAGSKEREEQDALSESFKDKYGDCFNVVFVGRMVTVKNVSMQLKAAAALKDQFPQFRLHVVGDGPLHEELQAEASNLGLGDSVVFHGRQEGLALGTFYREADAFLLTSFAEGWPMVIFEAMTAGLCVVMTDVGCAGEMIVDDKNGLVVPVDDHQALAKALEKLMTEDGLKDRLVAAATDNIKNYWTKEQILNGYKESWEKAFKNRL